MNLWQILNPAPNILWITLMTVYVLAISDDYYTAAVFEYAREGDDIQDNAAVVIKANLKNYDRATRAAVEQGADIIVFPEYGIFSPANRSFTRKFLELIPDPKKQAVTPCENADFFADRPILYTLSCMAKFNKIVIVANMGSVENCENEEVCPDDGNLHLNANVVFDQNGMLIGRYFKEHLYFEEGMDLPRTDQDPVFQTNFGKFATFICFDIYFEKIARISERSDIDAILFSKMWINDSPFGVSTQFLQAWAMGQNATIVSANIQMPGWFSTGSGIFMGRKGSIGHTLNPDGVSKLVVSKIPKNRTNISTKFSIMAVFENGTQKWNDDSRNIPDICSYSILGHAENVNKDYRCGDEDVGNYTLQKLFKTKGHMQLCNNKMCCELDYVTSNMNESYYFGVYNGTINLFDRYFYWAENCFLARCDDIDGKACSIFPMTTKTIFHKVHLTANFTSKKVYPSFVADRLQLVPVRDWTYSTNPGKTSIALESISGIPLLTATLWGRPFEKDPPYTR